MEILNKGLKYNLHNKQKHWIRNLACEAENAVTMLPPNEQQFMRYRVAQGMKHLLQQQQRQGKHISARTKHELKTVNLIKQKLNNSNAMITKADKGKFTIIIYKNIYEHKVMDFIVDNGATEVSNKLTKTFQKEVRKTVNECKQLINNNKKWNIINLNPNPPNTQRTDQSPQRERTDQTSSKLCGSSIIQTSKNFHRNTENTHPPPERLQP
jgi:hypothetical protein